METTDRQHFFDIQRTMEFVPHTQHEGWLDYIAAKRQKEIVYFIDNTENPSICCWGEIYVIPLVGRILRIEGESIKNEISV